MKSEYWLLICIWRENGTREAREISEADGRTETAVKEKSRRVNERLSEERAPGTGGGGLGIFRGRGDRLIYGNWEKKRKRLCIDMLSS